MIGKPGFAINLCPILPTLNMNPGHDSAVKEAAGQPDPSAPSILDDDLFCRSAY